MTPKQRQFAHNYAKSQNVYQSAIDAGYSHSFANTRGSQALLTNPAIAAEIKRIRERLNQTADKSSVDVVNELSKIAFADRVDFLKPDPFRDGEFMYKAPDELSSEQRSIVEKTILHTCDIVVMEEGKPKTYVRQEYSYVIADKAKALENMGRHFGIFDDKLRLGVSTNNPFKNISQPQLEKLRSAFVTTMSDPALMIEGTATEVKN